MIARDEGLFPEGSIRLPSGGDHVRERRHSLALARAARIMLKAAHVGAAIKVIMRFALLTGALAATLVASISIAADSTILTYHGAPDRAGMYVMPGLTFERARGLRPDLSFNAAYRGEVYAQPLLWRDPKTGAGALIVATEEDAVYAFDEKTGAQIWTRKLGDPVENGASEGFKCGDIWPLGVTGTPVIDK